MERSGEETTEVKLESYIKYLISKGYIDNENEDSETIHKFLEIYEQYENDNNTVSDGVSNNEETDPFETQAIFTLTDFLKGLGPSEYYDISAKIFAGWQSDEN